MKRNNDHNQTSRRSADAVVAKTTSYVEVRRRGNNAVAKATVAVVVSLLFLLAGLLDFFGSPDFSTFAGFTRTTKRAYKGFPDKCDVVRNQTEHIRLSESNHKKPISSPSSQSSATCPSYFRWIHEDLRPWKPTGITRAMIERARKTAHFRVVILDGKVYVEKYRKAIQTRDVFTMWGILQLLRWYPGRLPDLELMFDCDDRPTVRSKDFRGRRSDPPPLFRYCSDDASLDIVFPDWSFWGWAEVNIKPWGRSLEAIKEGNKRSGWKDRVPYAYWKGNPNVAPTRQDLLKCNASDHADWNTRIFVQDWGKESKEGFKNSNLENQCTYRYKIYIEGWAWSVSEKYILACDSMTLYVRPQFHDFYIRGMMPLQHYWPIRDNSKCTSLKFAVHWGNSHPNKAREIGKAGSRYVQEDVKMEFVYDYMFHLLNEYAKLLKFRPRVPRGAVEITSDNMGCPATGLLREFMAESLVESPSDGSPCVLPPPYDPLVLREVLGRKANLTRQVELWEDEYWRELNNKH